MKIQKYCTSSDARLSDLLLTVGAQMLDIVTPFNAEWYAAYRVATEETASYAHAPLIPCAFILQLRSLLSFILAVRTFEEHRCAFAKKSRHTNELSLFFSQ